MHAEGVPVVLARPKNGRLVRNEFYCGTVPKRAKPSSIGDKSHPREDRAWSAAYRGIMSRLLIGALTVSNVILLAYTFAPRKLLRRWMRQIMRRVPSSSSLMQQQKREGSLTKLGELLGKDYSPPLPKPVADALERSCLCFLATSNNLEPHLSLMRYTYTRGLDPNDHLGSEVMVISTQRKTKKFEILTENENVALLVHDFQTHRDGDHDSNYEMLGTRAKYSITLNGTVRVETGALAEEYRRVHLARNEQYKQFIVGSDIAIITVHLTRARVCDVNDHVTHYKKDGSTWSPTTSPNQ